MKRSPNHWLEQKRVAGPVNANCGQFRDGKLFIQVSDGGGWDHVSVSQIAEELVDEEGYR